MKNFESFIYILLLIYFPVSIEEDDYEDHDPGNSGSGSGSGDDYYHGKHTLIILCEALLENFHQNEFSKQYCNNIVETGYCQA